MRTVACAMVRTHTAPITGHAARYWYAARRCDGLPSLMDVLRRYVVSIGAIDIHIELRSSVSGPGLRSDVCAKSYFLDPFPAAAVPAAACRVSRCSRLRST